MKENKTAQAKPVLDGGRCSTQHKAVGLSCCPLGCLAVLHGCSRRTQALLSVHSWLRRVSPGSSCGEGGRGRCGFLISPCLCVLVCERGSERTRDSQGFFLCEAWTQREMFYTVGVFLSMSGTCFGAER